MAKLSKWERRHLANIARYEAVIDEIFKTAAREAAAIGTAISKQVDPGKPFSFADYPQTRRRVDTLMETLHGSLQTAVVNGARSGWALANSEDDELCAQVFGADADKLPGEVRRRYYTNNTDALEAFLSRKAEGLNLSDRVWNYTDQFKEEIEMSLDVGIRSGMSADELSRQVRQYLKEPNKLFRRVRDQYGELQLSRNAAAYHPGRGVYRSSYKNARRLTATETNIAYRAAHHERWQGLDFVVGILIEPSKTNHEPDICDDLKGRYPKDFKWTGWHPHCRCHALTILKTEEETLEDTRRILRGEEPTKGSVNEVKEIPQNLTDWVTANQERLAKAKTLPYWVKDNKKTVADIIKNAKDGAESRKSAKDGDTLSPLEKALGVKCGKPMTHEEADAMQPNPHYKEDVQYRINCQSCVVTYELRRRGYPLETYGNTNGSMASLLCMRTEAAWVDAEGNVPTPMVFKKSVKGRTVDRRGAVRNAYTTADEIYEEFLKGTAEEGRYHVGWYWKGKRTGHIITMEIKPDGTRVFYDPQSGKQKPRLLFPLGKLNLDKCGIVAYRVDNLQPNATVVKGIVKKAGSKAATPSMTAEQKEWWKKNVTDK